MPVRLPAPSLCLGRLRPAHPGPLAPLAARLCLSARLLSLATLWLTQKNAHVNCPPPLMDCTACSAGPDCRSSFPSRRAAGWHAPSLALSLTTPAERLPRLRRARPQPAEHPGDEGRASPRSLARSRRRRACFEPGYLCESLSWRVACSDEW